MAIINQMASVISATNAEIGQTSEITITPYSNQAVLHTVRCEFSGDTTPIVKTTISSYATSKKISWSIPASYYQEIINYRSIIATLYCESYDNNGVQIGTTTSCNIKISVPQTVSPSITASVEDTNQATLQYTGSPLLLIKGLSSARCSIYVQSNSFAHITKVTVNGIETEGTIQSYGDKEIFSTNLQHIAVYDEYRIEARDSRGFLSTYVLTPDYIKYKPLTCYPTIVRGTSDNTELYITVAGSYTEPTDSIPNTLTISYRYKAVTDTTWTDGGTISKLTSGSNDCILIHGGNSYTNLGSPIKLGQGFDAHKAYMIQLIIKDNLMEIESECLVNRSKPMFDYGEDDFNFNVPIKLNGENIFSLIYPVNSVFISTVNQLPTHISNIGTWGELSNSITGTYAWKRIN